MSTASINLEGNICYIIYLLISLGLDTLKLQADFEGDT